MKEFRDSNTLNLAELFSPIFRDSQSFNKISMFLDYLFFNEYALFFAPTRPGEPDLESRKILPSGSS